MHVCAMYCIYMYVCWIECTQRGCNIDHIIGVNVVTFRDSSCVCIRVYVYVCLRVCFPTPKATCV